MPNSAPRPWSLPCVRRPRTDGACPGSRSAPGAGVAEMCCQFSELAVADQHHSDHGSPNVASTHAARTHDPAIPDPWAARVAARRPDGDP